MRETEDSVRRESVAGGNRPERRAGGAHAAGASASPKASSAARKRGEGSAAGKARAGKHASSRAKGEAAHSAKGGKSTGKRRSNRKMTLRRKMKRFYARNRRLIWLFVVELVLALIFVFTAPLITPLILNHGGAKQPAEEATALPSETAQIPSTPTPAPTPTPEPDETPEPADAPEPTLPPEQMLALAYPTEYAVLNGSMQTDKELGLPEGKAVDDSYFDDACFVGDSVTLALRQYVTKMRKGSQPNLLGKAIFLATGSFRIQDTLAKVTKTSKHPTYKGKKMPLEDVLAKRQIKKVYIMLGMNDVAGVGPEKTVTNMGTLISRIQEKNPGIQIFIESVTPRLHGVAPATGTLFKYDILLYEQLVKAQLQNVFFVDVAYVMRASNGYLHESYCSDPNGMAMHFNDNGCKAWIQYLYTHTPPTMATTQISGWDGVEIGGSNKVSEVFAESES